MASSPAVQSVVRAIDLLQALNRAPVSTVAELHRETRIPKPSIIRLLQTLEACGLVRHAPQYGAYCLNAEVQTLSSGYHGAPCVVQAAAPIADGLTAEIKWPVAVGVFESDSMVVRYSTIPLSPLSLLQSTINMRLSLVSRAIGRAYLAYCEPEQRDHLMARLCESERDEDKFDPTALMVELVCTRERGYALRCPTVRPVSATLAVPIFDAGRVVAAIGITWFSSALSPKQACRRRSKSDPPRRSNIDPGMDADRVMVGCGQV